MKATLEELHQIITLPAKSMSDKVVLMDARDRIVRLRREALQKNTASNGTKSLKGTCPDMCPEKERYSRCEKRRLAPYEMIETSGKVCWFCWLIIGKRVHKTICCRIMKLIIALQLKNTQEAQLIRPNLCLTS